VSLGAVGRDAYQPPVLRDRRVVIALLDESHAEVVMSDRVVRVEPDRLVERRDRTFGVALRDEGEPQLDVGLDEAGLQFCHGPECFDRFFDVFVAALSQGQPEVIMRVGVIGYQLHGFPQG
jgi:hypothetical protein